MKYRKLGKTGIECSLLGFGCMRLPEKKVRNKTVVDRDTAIAIIRRGIDLGINYVDSAYFYHGGESEVVLGQALKDGYRKKVYLSTKLPTGRVNEPYDFDRLLDEQMKKLDVDSIDFYHFHYLNQNLFDEKVKGMKLIDRMQKAKAEGLIEHIAFSFHDKPEVLKQIIDTGWFESMLVQYNLLDRSNEDMIQYAREKGLGVTVMGPIGGGRLGEPSKAIQELLPNKNFSSPEIALKFVFSNPYITCALSGMGTLEMVEENARIASSDHLLTNEELQQMNVLADEYKAQSKLYCTECKYCMPCPNEVNIPLNFKLMNYYRIYNIPEYARQQYQLIGKVDWMPGKTADACTECGECEPKCPQKIPIIEQLKQVAEVFEER